MVKDSKSTASAADGDGGEASVLLETSTPRVPSFEQLQSEEQTAIRLSYDLLRYNIIRLPPTATADAEAEAEQAGRSLLGNSSAVNDLMASRPGSQLSSSSLGREMVRLADAFRVSQQGSEADRIAGEVNLADLNRASFTEILERLFHSGYSLASFVTLFHFVARLLQRAYTERGDSGFKALCHELMLAFFWYLLSNVIKFLVKVFHDLSQERRVAVMSFVSGVVVASLAAGAVAYFVLRRAGRQ